MIERVNYKLKHCLTEYAIMHHKAFISAKPFLITQFRIRESYEFNNVYYVSVIHY